MKNIVFYIAICMVFPMCFSLIVFAKKARLLNIFMLIGIYSCLLCSELNGLILKYLNNNYLFTTTSYTPVVEELVKAIPIIIYAFVYKPDRKTLMMTGFMDGVGFAMLENMVYVIKNLDDIGFGYALSRGLCAGLMHSVCTMVVGFGIYTVYKKKKLHICGTFSLLGLVIMYHSIFNILVQSEHVWWGYIMPFNTFIIIVCVTIWLRRKNKLKIQE